MSWLAIEGLPEGLELAEDGAVCGTPTEAGRFEVVVQVADRTGLSDTGLLQLSIRGDEGCAIETVDLPGAAIGAAYEARIEPSGRCVLPARFAVIDGAGALPPGLELAEDGVLAGIPTAVGAYVFGVRLVDGAGSQAQAALSVMVSEPPRLEEAEAGCRCAGAGRGPSRWGLLGLFVALVRRRSR